MRLCGRVFLTKTMPAPKVPLYIWTSVALVALAGIIAGASRAASGPARTSPERSAKQLLITAKQKCNAAMQDTDMLMNLTDAHYGLAYVAAARLLSLSDTDLEALTQINVGDLSATLEAEQQQAQAWLSKSPK